MEVSTSILRGFAGVLRSEGIESASVLRSAGISPKLFEPRLGALDVDVPERVISAALRAFNVPALGLLLGSKAPLQSLGIVGGILLHAPTLRKAMGSLDTYLPLMSPRCSFAVREDQQHAALVMLPPAGDAQISRFCTEVAFAFTLRVAQQLAPGVAPVEVRLRDVSASYEQQMRETFACGVRYGSQRNEIVFERSVLDQTQPFEDAAIWHLFKHRADELLSKETQREPLHERVEQLLRYDVDLGYVSAVAVARRLHMTPSNLRRRLGQEGRPLHEIANKVRRELALRALAETDESIKEIASRTGFAGVRTFHRAFKRWTNGNTPGRFRAEAARGSVAELS